MNYFEAAIEAVCQHYSANKKDVISGKRQYAALKKEAIYIAHCTFSATKKDCAKVFETSGTGVTNALAWVEDSRDYGCIDEALDKMEDLAKSLAK